MAMDLAGDMATRTFIATHLANGLIQTTCVKRKTWRGWLWSLGFPVDHNRRLYTFVSDPRALAHGAVMHTDALIAQLKADERWAAMTREDQQKAMDALAGRMA